MEPVVERCASTSRDVGIPVEEECHGDQLTMPDDNENWEEAASGEVTNVSSISVSLTNHIGWSSEASSAPTMKLQLKIGEVVYIALVDTGASKSMISHTILKESGVAINTTNRSRVYGFAEEVGVYSVGTAEVSLWIGGITMKPCKFLVLPSKIIMPSPVILGVDFLRRNGAVVDGANRCLALRSKNVTVELYMDQHGKLMNCCLCNLQCIAQETVTLRKGETTEIPVMWKSGVDTDSVFQAPLFYNGDVPHGLDHHLSGIPGIVDSSVERSTLLLTNKGDRDVNVKRGTFVGVLTSTVDPGDCNEPDPASKPKTWTWQELQDCISLTHLSEDQQQQVYKILDRHKSIISTGDDDIGRINTVPHRIDLYDQTPIYQRPRRFPAPVADEIEQQCRGLQDLGIIEASASPWSSPVVPVRKKDGSIRLCVDYRSLNRVTKPDKFPIPNLSDSIFGLYGVKYFTRLDLVRGFYQVPLNEESKELTAFSTPHGHWHFNVLSFGLKNAPSAFQRGMQEVLREFPWKKVVVYVDDILIMENSFDSHLALVGDVLHTLADHGIKIKPEKCDWFKPQVEFLGHIVSNRGVSKTAVYVNKVSDFPQPETVRQLREFLGLINFQRKFIQNCSEIQKPLSALTGGAKNKKINWTSEMLEAFQQLQNLMKQNIELAFPDYSSDAEKLELWVDASHVGSGACLTQIQHGELRIIAFASTCFDKAQHNYSILEKELAAMRWGIKSFRAFLYGIDFVLRTDHQPLVYLHNMRLVDSRLARTLEDMADFNFTIKFTPGHLNSAADALSRLKRVIEIENKEPNNKEQGMPPGLTLDGSPIPGGPNSLFESLLRGLIGVADRTQDIPRTHVELRGLLVDELIMHSVMYNLKLSKYIRRDLKIMRHVDQLPSMEVLLAASKLFCVRIFVYCWEGDPILFQAPLKTGVLPEKVVHLQCLGGVHFNSLVETREYNEAGFHPNCVLASFEERPSASGEALQVAEVITDVVACECADLLVCEGRELLSCQHVACDQPRVKVKIGNYYYCAILDTCAEISIINESILDESSVVLLDQIETKVEVVGLTKKSKTVLRKVELSIFFNADAGPYVAKLAVLPDKTLPCCILLGMDFITKYYVKIDLKYNWCKVGAGEVIQLLDAKYSDADVYVGVVERSVNSIQSLSIGSPESNVHFDLTWENGIISCPRGPFQVDDLFRLQRGNYQLRTLHRVLQNETPKKKWPRVLSDFKRHASGLVIDNEVVCYKSKSVAAVVPFNILVEVALVFHHKLSHIGRDKILDLLLKHVWHPGIHKVVSDVCVSCKQCQLLKASPLRILPPTLKVTTSYPFELVAVDLVEFGRTASGYIGCLMVVDHNSKWLSAVPIRNKTALVVANAMERQVLPYLPSVPGRILTDNGPEFRSSTFSDLLEKYNISHVLTTPYKPSSNGAVERVNRTIGSFLANLSQSNQWDKSLTKAILTYNHTMHREIQMSPAEYLLSIPHQLHQAPCITDSVQQCWKAGHPRFSPFKIGEKVIRKIPYKGRTNANKFSDKFEGPFKIVTVIENNVTFKIQSVLEPSKILNVHYEQLRPWTDPPKYLVNHPYYAILYPDLSVGGETSVADLSVGSDHESGLLNQSTDIFNNYNDFNFSDSGSEIESTTSDDESRVSQAVIPAALNRSILYPKYDSPDFEISNRTITLSDSMVASVASFPSGCVLPAVDETWKMSPILRAGLDVVTCVTDESIELNPSINYCDFTTLSNAKYDLPSVSVDVVENVLDSVFEAADLFLDQMGAFVDECCDIVSHSFEGFEPDIQDAVDRSVSPLKNKLLTLRKIVRGEIQKSSKRKVSSFSNEGEIVTRSKGPVKDYLNVQPYILERKKKD